LYHAYDVREQFWKNYVILGERYGEKYLNEQLEEIIAILIKSQNYLFRVSALRGFAICGNANNVIPLLQAILGATEKETVSNVTMELVNAIVLNYQYVPEEDSSMQQQLRQRLEGYTIHEDFDISYLAMKACKDLYSMQFPFLEEDEMDEQQMLE